MIEASRVTVTGSATLLLEASATADARQGAHAVLIPVTGSASVFLGPAGVTDADGVEWDPSLGPLSIELEPGEALYGVRAAAAGNQDVHVLAGGK